MIKQKNIKRHNEIHIIAMIYYSNLRTLKFINSLILRRNIQIIIYIYVIINNIFHTPLIFILCQSWHLNINLVNNSNFLEYLDTKLLGHLSFSDCDHEMTRLTNYCHHVTYLLHHLHVQCHV